MTIEVVKLTEQAKNQLAKLARFAGITHRNVLCRWGLCLSLAEATTPPSVDGLDKPAIEIPWRVFGGKSAELYMALLVHHSRKVKWEDEIEQLLLRHIHRGLGYLAGESTMPTISHIMQQVARCGDRASGLNPDLMEQDSIRHSK